MPKLTVQRFLFITYLEYGDYKASGISLSHATKKLIASMDRDIQTLSTRINQLEAQLSEFE